VIRTDKRNLSAIWAVQGPTRNCLATIGTVITLNLRAVTRTFHCSQLVSGTFWACSRYGIHRSMNAYLIAISTGFEDEEHKEHSEPQEAPYGVVSAWRRVPT